MSQAITKKERARRQRAMIEFRNWFEANGIHRRDVAAQLGITVGHLSTLINANRTPTAAQAEMVLILMDGTFSISQSLDYDEIGVEPILPANKAKSKAKTMKRAEGSKKASTRKSKPPLRSMTKFETKFVTDIAEAWILANKGASSDDLVEIVRLLSIGIRS